MCAQAAGGPRRCGRPVEFARQAPFAGVRRSGHVMSRQWPSRCRRCSAHRKSQEERAAGSCHRQRPRVVPGDVLQGGQAGGRSVTAPPGGSSIVVHGDGICTPTLTTLKLLPRPTLPSCFTLIRTSRTTMRPGVPPLRDRISTPTVWGWDCWTSHRSPTSRRWIRRHCSRKRYPCGRLLDKMRCGPWGRAAS